MEGKGRKKGEKRESKAASRLRRYYCAFSPCVTGGKKSGRALSRSLLFADAVEHGQKKEGKEKKTRRNRTSASGMRSWCGTWGLPATVTRVLRPCRDRMGGKGSDGDRDRPSWPNHYAEEGVGVFYSLPSTERSGGKGKEKQATGGN